MESEQYFVSLPDNRQTVRNNIQSYQSHAKLIEPSYKEDKGKVSGKLWPMLWLKWNWKGNLWSQNKFDIFY